MTYDPYQAFSQQGSYPGIVNPVNFPYSLQQQIFPNAAASAATLNPFAAAALGLPSNIQHHAHNHQLGVNPQQLQLAAAILASQGLIPQFQGLGNGIYGQNPQLNPAFYSGPQFATLGQQQPFGLGQQNNPYQNQGNPYQTNPYQINPYQNNPFVAQGSPYSATLAPQSWVGQPGLYGATQQPFAQPNLLTNQFGQRAFQTPGVSPWGY